MVKDLRLDPLFERRKRTLSVPSSLPLKKIILQKYRETVDQTIAFRVSVMVPIAIILHLIFSVIDFHFYPLHAILFLKIRIIDGFLILLACLPVLAKRRNKFVVWAADFCVLVMSGAVILMIYLTDGASSYYFAGVNLTIVAMLIVNSFYLWHALFTSLIVIVLFATATLLNQSGFDLMKFYSSNYFVASTAFLVVLMTKFYSEQHFKAFASNEDLKEDERKLEILYGMADEKAKIDDLTKIYNRGYFLEILSAKINACRNRNSFFYLTIFDIDRFKEINDTCGHVFGDQVIMTVAKTVQNIMRMNSYMGRYGGDEFMIIIDEATQEEFLLRLQEIRQAIQSMELLWEGKPVSISASFGAAQWEPGIADEKRLISLADSALLEVKRTRRGEIKLAGSV